MPQKVGRNEPCPCGSGRKYKRCCYEKDFDYEVDEYGTVRQVVPMTDEVEGILRKQLDRFRLVHGREPGPEDKVFFDAPPAEIMEHQMVQIMHEAGIEPAKIQAFIETGRIVSDDNLNLIPTSDLEHWNVVIDQFRSKHGKPVPTMPWSRSEWGKQKVSDLEKNKKFWKYLGSIKDELFSNKELVTKYMRLMQTILVAHRVDEFESLDREQIHSIGDTLQIDQELLSQLIEIAFQIEPAEGFSRFECFEFQTFIVDFAENAHERVVRRADKDFEDRVEKLRAVSLMQLVLAINEHFGIADAE